MVVPTLLISGPVGVGKTTVGGEVSAVLGARGVPHTFVDVDALCQTFPGPPDDPFNDRLGLAVLRDLWRHASAVGSRNLILSRVLETDDGLAAVGAALPAAAVVVVQLRASPATLVERVGRRELGAGYEWHAARAVELAEILEQAPADHRVDTDGRSPVAIAEELVELVCWV